MLFAVLDLLLPGDEGEPPLPSASAAGLDAAGLAHVAEPVLEALGDHDGFLTASTAARVVRLRAVEQARPDAFKALLAEALAGYYEAPPVLTALGWRVAPPQPHGHDVAPTDPSTLRLLEAVKQRGPLWRA
jgi:hypothetical protein